MIAYIDITGILGMVLLFLAYLAWLMIKSDSIFFATNFVASTLLTVHAIILVDIPFIIVNGFIALVMLVKLIKELNKSEVKNENKNSKKC